MEFTSEFNFGDVVRLKTDVMKKSRIITEVTLRPGHHKFYLSFEQEGSWHYEIEFDRTEEKQKAGFFQPGQS